ncbi:MAG: hypothetical protein BWY76_00566 [bacterium ADurb.Bin429]|nr:MAG: hypothetical protein BWY76_00566 [bacterium ADurb.Bin429]
MIRGKTRVATACRTKDGQIIVQRGEAENANRHPIWRLAFLRGTPALVDSLRLGYKTLMWSADIAMEGEPEQKKPTPLAYALTIAASIALAVGLFILLPSWLSGYLPFHPDKHAAGKTLWEQFIPTGPTFLYNVAEGVGRVLMLIGYILVVGRSKEVQRVFAYHGAEHKVVNGYEAGAELTVEGVKPYSRIHPRCGTSFIFLFFVVGILMHAAFGWPENVFIRFASRLLMIPLIAGVAYELIRLAGRFRDNLLLKILVFPGMLLQRLTTAEPQDDQIEVALASMRAVLTDEGVLQPEPAPAPEIPIAGLPAPEAAG